MKRFKLKEDFAGKKAGDILEFKDPYTAIIWSYKSAIISLNINLELLEEVIESPVIMYTNEDIVYLDYKGNRELKVGDTYYIILNNAYTTGVIYGDITLYKDFSDNNTCFKTKEAANDCLRLQKAIKDSGLKVRDCIDNRSEEYYNSDFKWVKSFDKSFIVKDFKIVDNQPCLIRGFNLAHKLEDYIKPKLIFGGNEVTIRKHTYSNEPWTSDVFIVCNNETSLYSNCKKLMDALIILKEFKFGTKPLTNSKQTAFKDIDTLRVGCTTGTITEAKAILKACEELLKEDKSRPL
jgi:hypothetical protein